MAEPGWHYRIGEIQHGPLTLPQLQQLVASGQIGPATMVWADHLTQWQPVSAFPFLRTPNMVPRDDGGALNLLLPIGPQSGFAIAAGYLGLFSVFLFPAPLAIIFGILALRDLKAHPEKRGMGRAITGIVMGSLVTLGFLALVVIGRHH
jgi:hypothetical protein